jgi:hypothetical protein
LPASAAERLQSCFTVRDIAATTDPAGIIKSNIFDAEVPNKCLGLFNAFVIYPHRNNANAKVQTSLNKRTKVVDCTAMRPPSSRYRIMDFRFICIDRYRN